MRPTSSLLSLYSVVCFVYTFLIVVVFDPSSGVLYAEAGGNTELWASTAQRMSGCFAFSNDSFCVQAS